MTFGSNLIQSLSLPIYNARNVSTKKFNLAQHVPPAGGPETFIIRTKRQHYIEPRRI